MTNKIIKQIMICSSVVFALYIALITIGINILQQPKAISDVTIETTTIPLDLYKPTMPYVTDAALYREINFNTPTFDIPDKPEVFIKYSFSNMQNHPDMIYACLGPDTPIQSTNKVKWLYGKYDTKTYTPIPFVPYGLGGEYTSNNLVLLTNYTNKLYNQYMSVIKDYIDKTNNHILLRIRPRYHTSQNIPFELQIECYSIEDNGYGLKTNIIISNIKEK